MGQLFSYRTIDDYSIVDHWWAFGKAKSWQLGTGNWQLADGDKQNRFRDVLCDLCALCGKRLGVLVCINDGGIVDHWWAFGKGKGKLSVVGDQ